MPHDAPAGINFSLLYLLSPLLGSEGGPILVSRLLQPVRGTNYSSVWGIVKLESFT